MNKTLLLFLGVGALFAAGCGKDEDWAVAGEESKKSPQRFVGLEKSFIAGKTGPKKFEADIGVLQDLIGGEISIKIAMDTEGLVIEELESDCSCFKDPRSEIVDGELIVKGSIFPRNLREDFIFNPSLLLKSNRGNFMLSLKGRLAATFIDAGERLELAAWEDLKKSWNHKIALDSSFELPDDLKVVSSNPDIKVEIDSVKRRGLVIDLQVNEWSNSLNLETELTVSSSQWRVPFQIKCLGEIASDVEIDDGGLNVGIVKQGAVAVGEALVSHKKMGSEFLLQVEGKGDSISVQSMEPGVYRVRLSAKVEGDAGALFQKSYALTTNDPDLPIIKLRLRGIVHNDRCCQ